MSKVIEEGSTQRDLSAELLLQARKLPKSSIEVRIVVRYGVSVLELPVRFRYVKGAMLDVQFYTLSASREVEESVKEKVEEQTFGVK